MMARVAKSADRQQGAGWVEIVATVLLALAAVATAWSSYQANRWNGEQAKAAARVNALRIEAARPGTRRGPDPGRYRDVLPVGERHRYR